MLQQMSEAAVSAAIGPWFRTIASCRRDGGSHRVTLWSHVPKKKGTTFLASAWPQAISMNTSPLWQPSSLAMLSLCWRSKRKSTRQPQPLSWASLGWNHTRQHPVILEILVSPQVWKPLNGKPLLQCNTCTRRANRMF